MHPTSTRHSEYQKHGADHRQNMTTTNKTMLSDQNISLSNSKSNPKSSGCNLLSLKGKLYIAATPIGNLNDISLRFVETAKKVDLILCEDTRQSKKLMHAINCSTALFAYHRHNEKKSAPKWIDKLQHGYQIMLISDAGTPAIQDPGHELISQCHALGIRVCCLPGPSSITAALSISGINAHPFTYLGYLHAKLNQARQQLMQARRIQHALIVLLTPHKIMNQINCIMDIFGKQQRASLIKEISKINEQVCLNSLKGISDWLKEDHHRQRGEFVLIIDNHAQKQQTSVLRNHHKNSPSEEKNKELAFYPNECVLNIMQSLLTELPLKSAAKHAANISGQSRQQIYRYYAQQKD